jgi:hypothetical protein
VSVCERVFFCVCVQVERPCDELITRPRSPTDCLRSRKPKWNEEFHGGRPGPKRGCSAQKKCYLILRWNLVLEPKLSNPYRSRSTEAINTRLVSVERAERREKTNIKFWSENLQETIMWPTYRQKDKMKMDLGNWKWKVVGSQ